MLLHGAKTRSEAWGRNLGASSAATTARPTTHVQMYAHEPLLLREFARDSLCQDKKQIASSAIHGFLP